MYKFNRCSQQAYRTFTSSTSLIVVENVFSASNKKRTIEMLEKVNPLRRMLKGVSKKAAVCVPMCTVNKQPSVIFTLRSTALPSHQGEVSFPGGKWQQSDADLIETALREMNEELNIHPSTVDVWGKLLPIPDYSKTIAVTPVLCYIGHVELNEVKTDPSEVSEIFSIPLAVLCDPLYTRYTRYHSPATPTRDGYTYSLPVFLGGAHKVWGLTALAMDQCLKALLPELYVPVVEQIIDKVEHANTAAMAETTVRSDRPVKGS